jgi:2,3-bisphosphoglycerate-independent phosphoglycerate mutase
MTRRNSPPPRVLLVFLDGVGIGAKDARRNPFFASPPAFLRDLLGGALPSLRDRHLESGDAVCVPTDPTLGVPGLPQSGTGQCALYTGVNAARIVGHHFGPYVYSTLKPVVAASSIFARLAAAGFGRDDCALANAFPRRFFEYLAGGHPRMVAGMYAAMTAGIPFRDAAALARGEAVSTDITAARWKDLGHPEAPVISAYEAGTHLARIAGGHRFTLFEYFLTDKAGHERSFALAAGVIDLLDEFVRGIRDGLRASPVLVVIASDHGNMEELSVKTHTRHPVPIVFFGAGMERFPRVFPTIAAVVPAIVDFLRD